METTRMAGASGPQDRAQRATTHITSSDVSSVATGSLAPVAKRIMPSAVTLSGLFLALWAVQLIIEQRFAPAAWLLLVATLLDAVDGNIARALGSVSDFGKDLDSLVDFCVAGVVPAIFIHQLYFVDAGVLGLLPAFFWVSFVAARLARFNNQVSTDRKFFAGVPCPTAATALVQFALFSRATFGHDGHPAVVVALVAVLGLLMLSSIAYEKSYWLMPRVILRNSYGLGLLGMIIAMPLVPNQTMFVGTTGSILIAVVRFGAKRVRSRSGRAALTATTVPVAVQANA